MTFGDIFGLSLRNLRQAKLRTFLTTLGVSIGIASLTGMVSLGIGLQDQILGRLLQSGVFDTITVVSPAELGAAGALLAGQRGLRGGGRGRGGLAGAGNPEAPAPKLDDDAIKQISAVQNVREAFPSLRVPVEMKIGEFSRPVGAAGIPMSSKAEGVFQTLSYGQFFTNENENECMVSLDLAKQIAEQDPASVVSKSATLTYAASHPSVRDPDSPLGFQVQRVDMQCRIVGVVERDPGAFTLGGGPPVAVMLPIGVAKKIDSEVVTNARAFLGDASKPKTYTAVTVKVKQPQFTQDVESGIRRLGYTVFSVNDALRGAKNAFIMLDIVLSLIGSIALAVSSLGIVNTMVMSILERTREIGIMKAIGASNEHIRRIFLIEASVIGSIGGFLGIALGWAVGRVINFGANVYIRSQGGTGGSLFSVPAWLIASAIAFSILVSLIAGSYPASRAARLDPIQALRHD